MGRGRTVRQGSAYQWQDCDGFGANCSSISGATSSSYELASGDAGATIDVVVTASNSAGSGQASSGGDGRGDGSGAAAGEYVAADDHRSAGGWGYADRCERFVVERSDRLQLSMAAGLRFVGCELFEHFGATSGSYKLASGDAGATIDVVVTASNSAGSGQASSAATALVTVPVQPPVNTSLPDDHRPDGGRGYIDGG